MDEGEGEEWKTLWDFVLSLEDKRTFHGVDVMTLVSGQGYTTQQLQGLRLRVIDFTVTASCPFAADFEIMQALKSDGTLVQLAPNEKQDIQVANVLFPSLGQSVGMHSYMRLAINKGKHYQFSAQFPSIRKLLVARLPRPHHDPTQAISWSPQEDPENPRTSPLKHMRICSECGMGWRCNMAACSRCKSCYYCSKACQKRAWKRHKLSCVAPAPLDS